MNTEEQLRIKLELEYRNQITKENDAWHKALDEIEANKRVLKIPIKPMDSFYSVDLHYF